MSAFLFFRIQLFMINFAEIFIPIMDKDLFKTIDTVIRKERLYAQANLMREDVMQRFSIGRHHLNDQLNSFADGMSFPQYINSIRMEVAYDLLTNRSEMTITEIAREVGFSAPNLREQFKRCYGITPAEYRATLVPKDDGFEP
ncbi:MAG: AraC family transcriptional regulator [Prevotella sp.]|jgi:AraC-like DNA-binding protein|nr:AraC family transcriptional regulator [Prevotella sp.]